MAIPYHEILELKQRSNVTIREWRDKAIVIYDDHRWILNVLFYLRKNGLLIKPNVIFFDAHDDAVECEKKSALLSKLDAASIDEASVRNFMSFVEFDISCADDDWVSVACELDMVGDVVCIGNRTNDNIESMNGEYTSEDGICHGVFGLSGNLEFELGWRGALGDSMKSLEYAGVRKFYKSGDTIYKGIGKMLPYVLDIDLDCFTLDVKENPTMAWSEKTYFHNYPAYSPSEAFISKLLQDSEIITICREPDYCGAIGESNRILEMLDNLWFEGSIGAGRVY